MSRIFLDHFSTLFFLRHGLAVKPRLTQVATTNQAYSKTPISSSEGWSSSGLHIHPSFMRESPILFLLIVCQGLWLPKRDFTSLKVMLKRTKSQKHKNWKKNVSACIRQGFQGYYLQVILRQKHQSSILDGLDEIILVQVNKCMLSQEMLTDPSVELTVVCLVVKRTLLLSLMKGCLFWPNAYTNLEGVFILQANLS